MCIAVVHLDTSSQKRIKMQTFMNSKQNIYLLLKIRGTQFFGDPTKMKFADASAGIIQRLDTIGVNVTFRKKCRI